MIEVQGFHKVYGSAAVVHDLSFSVEAGRILGLVGPNGAGKTTTMRAIAGIIPPTRGALRVAGHDIVSDPIRAKRGLAYVPDDPRLFEALTVWEHFRFIASAYELTGFESDAERLLERFDLGAKRDALIQELSRGMRQKAAICCAYLHRPRAILLDEPMTGLDPRGIRSMKDSIRERAAEGTAFVISSHLLDLVEDLCTDLLILHKGRSLYFGSINGARNTLAADSADASLEELFLRATEEPDPEGTAR
jgi:ABC-2 type transport system ATP-binding protein